MLNRESVALALVYPVVELLRRRQRWLAVLVAVPAAAAIAVLRFGAVLTSHAVEGVGVVSPVSVVADNARWYGSATLAAVCAVVYAWGLTPLLGRSLVRAAFRTSLLAFAVATIAALSLATDWMRLLGHLFPVVCLAMASSNVLRHRAWGFVGVQAASSAVVLHAGFRPSAPVACTILVAQALVLLVAQRSVDATGAPRSQSLSEVAPETVIGTSSTRSDAR